MHGSLQGYFSYIILLGGWMVGSGGTLRTGSMIYTLYQPKITLEIWCDLSGDAPPLDVSWYSFDFCDSGTPSLHARCVPTSLQSVYSDCGSADCWQCHSLSYGPRTSSQNAQEDPPNTPVLWTESPGLGESKNSCTTGKIKPKRISISYRHSLLHPCWSGWRASISILRNNEMVNSL